MRRANFPEFLSEGLTSALMNWPCTNGTSFVGLDNNSMDLVDTKNGKTIQLKSCSTDAKHNPGPISFGLRTKFDKLISMHMNCENDTADQQKIGRCPRLTILNKIKENNLVPFMTYTFSKN